MEIHKGVGAEQSAEDSFFFSIICGQDCLGVQGDPIERASPALICGCLLLDSPTHYFIEDLSKQIQPRTYSNK